MDIQRENPSRMYMGLLFPAFLYIWDEMRLCDLIVEKHMGGRILSRISELETKHD